MFSYDIYFDLNLRSSKNVIDKTHEGRFIVLNAIVKDGKIRQKSISPITTTFALNGFVRNYSNQSMMDLDDNDTFESRISEIFTESEIK